jgi:small redox-active disulfide protein 2
MIIKLLGSSDCSSCQKLEALVKRATDELGVEVDIVKVTDATAIASFGIMALPGMVVDDEVVIGGRIPSYDELKSVLRAASAR